MAEMPSSIVASAAQAPVQARHLAEQADVRRAEQIQAGKRQTQTLDEAGVIVDTADDDQRIFADAEGSGGQGRSLDEELNSADEPSESAEEPMAEPGIHLRDGRLHLDLEA